MNYDSYGVTGTAASSAPSAAQMTANSAWTGGFVPAIASAPPRVRPVTTADSIRPRGTSRGASWVRTWIAIGLLVGGCGHLTQISEEGGLIPRFLARDDAADTSPGAVIPDAGLPVPYRPADFENHAADREFTLHWTAARGADRVEVKGLIENRAATTPVAGLTLALSSPERTVTAAAPGIVRPGEIRPFYFAAVFPGDERRAQLSVVSVDRSAPQAEEPVTSKRPGKQVVRSSPAEMFGRHAEDHFFTVHWNTTTKGGETDVDGLVENRDGPALQGITLAVEARSAGGQAVKVRRRVWGPIDKKSISPFTATLPAGVEPDGVNVSVESYEFFHPSAGGN